MGLPSLLSNIRFVPNIVKVIVSSILSFVLFPHLKRTINLVLGNLIVTLLKLEMPEDFMAEPDFRPSGNWASLVPVPAHIFVDAVKRELPIMPFEGKDVKCIICLSKVEERQEVRVLSNCCHVFHRECLDVWVDQGQGTCPLCRSKLLPSNNGQDQKDGDHWRRERMVYLFGEEYYLFGEDDHQLFG